MPLTTALDTGGIVLGLHDLHHHVRVEVERRARDVAHDLGQAIGRHHRDDAREMTKRGEDRRGLRRDHRRAVQRAFRRGHGRGHVGDVERAAGDRQQPRLRALVEHRLLAAGNRQRRSSARGRRAWPARRPRPSSRASTLLVVDLFDRDRGVSVVRPDPGRPAAPAALRRVERQHAAGTPGASPAGPAADEGDA